MKEDKDQEIQINNTYQGGGGKFGDDNPNNQRSQQNQTTNGGLSDSANNSGVKTPDEDLLQEEINKLKERCKELEDNWKRALADYKNLERRTLEEKEEFIELANMVLLGRILPILDNLELLEKHIDDTGLKMVVKEFKQILTDAGLRVIESDGKEFESETMECIETVESDADNNNKVLETTRKGYKFKNKVLRPAQVRVGKVKN